MQYKGFPLLFILFSFLSSGRIVFGTDSMDATSHEAVKKTQQLLKNSKLRENPPVKTEQTQWINDHVKSLAGNKGNTDEIFELSAEIFGTIAQEANGDPVKMMEILEGYKKNPHSLDKKLTSRQRQRLKEIAGKIESQKAGSNPEGRN